MALKKSCVNKLHCALVSRTLFLCLDSSAGRCCVYPAVTSRHLLICTSQNFFGVHFLLVINCHLNFSGLCKQCICIFRSFSSCSHAKYILIRSMWRKACKSTQKVHLFYYKYMKNGWSYIVKIKKLQHTSFNKKNCFWHLIPCIYYKLPTIFFPHSFFSWAFLGSTNEECSVILL